MRTVVGYVFMACRSQCLVIVEGRAKHGAAFHRNRKMG